MKINVFAFGKLKTPGLRETADYYLKLAQNWVSMEEIELRPMRVLEKDPALRKKIQVQEGNLLLNRLPATTGRHVFYLLDETGKTQTTQDWAQMIRDHERDGLVSLSFCVGSSLGFSSELRARAKASLNLGLQTLPHELARVVLCEQIYRALSILRGHPYHNDGT